jgi:chorismate-pyruvate lyase
VADLVKTLCGLFYDASAEVGLFEEVAAGDLPDQFKALLAHDDHMTVTVEAWHNSLVKVQVLEERRDKDLYARRIVLSLQRDGMPVQYGIMRINLAGLPQIVRMEIESQALPLGRIMIRHHLMRRVELLNLWRVSAGSELRKHLKVERGAVCFGRTARILFNNVPSVELLEIVTL